MEDAELDEQLAGLSEKIRRQLAQRQYLDYYCDTPWARWLVEVLPDTFVPKSGRFEPFAEYHREFWEWVWEIEPGGSVEPLLPCWPRDGGKSRSTEAAFVFLGGEKRRNFGIYCCDNQVRSDEHLGNVSGLLELPTVQQRYPDLCEKALTQYGVSKGWRVNLLRTKSGFSAASAGLDHAVRGTRLDDQRPDFIALDDVDNERDSAKEVAKKEKTIATAIIPAGARGRTAIVFAQNLVHPNSVMCHILDGKADFLRDRRVSGPHPAVVGLEYVEEVIDGKKLCRITSGTPTWEGMPLEDCERMMNTEGPNAFLSERQHQRDAKKGALWTRDLIEENRRDRPDHLVRITVNVDPEASGTRTGAKTGITVTARAADGHGYLLANDTDHYRGTTRGISGSTVDAGWGQKVVDLVEEWNADCVVAETNQGGDMVRSIIHLINANISVEDVRAKHGKHLRAEPVAQLYRRGLIHHVGVFEELEDQMCEVYDPDHPTITWDDMDSMVYGFRYLLLPGKHDVLRNLDPNLHRIPRPEGPPKDPPVILG